MKTRFPFGRARHIAPPLRLAVTVAFVACNGTTSEGPAHSTGEADATCARSTLLVAASDFNQGDSDLGLLALDGGASFSAGGPTLGSDPALASSAGRVFWIDRTSGNILELDPRCAAPLAEPWSTNDPGPGGSTNPQDIAVDPATGNLWIARFKVSTILVKSSDGATDLGRIDLSTVAGVNRNPYMSSIRIIDLGNGEGPKAYVTLEMLFPYPMVTQPSYIVRLDVATALQTGKVEAALELQGRNPFGLMVEYDKALYLAEPGSFTDATETGAGIEKVDLASFTSKLLVRESDIGASVDQVSITSGCATAIVAAPNAENTTSVISFDPATGAIVTPLSARFLTTDAGFELGGMTWLDGGLNVIGDGTGVSGEGYAVHVLTASSTCTLTESARSLYAPLPPIAFVPVP